MTGRGRVVMQIVERPLADVWIEGRDLAIRTRTVN